MRNFIATLVACMLLITACETAKDRKLQEINTIDVIMNQDSIEHAAHARFVDSAMSQSEFFYIATEEIVDDKPYSSAYYINTSEDSIAFRHGFYNNAIHKIAWDDFLLFETWLAFNLRPAEYTEDNKLIVYVNNPKIKVVIDDLPPVIYDYDTDKSLSVNKGELAVEIWYLCQYSRSKLE